MHTIPHDAEQFAFDHALTPLPSRISPAVQGQWLDRVLNAMSLDCCGRHARRQAMLDDAERIADIAWSTALWPDRLNGF